MNRDIDNVLYAIWLAKEVKDLTANTYSQEQFKNPEELPPACFLWIGDLKKRSTWHIPYRQGYGEKINGVYEQAGAVSINILKAVSEAVADEHHKGPTQPAQIKAKIKKLLKQYSINEYTGRTEPMETKKEINFTEASIDGQFSEVKIDKENRIIPGVAIMRESTGNVYYPGSKGTLFSENFRNQVATFVNGRKVYADHATDQQMKEMKGVRSIRDLIGYYENGHIDSSGVVRADLRYLSNQASWIEPLIEEMSDKVGLSISAAGPMAFNPSTKMAEAISCSVLRSVDLVTEPGSTANIFESKNEEKDEGDDMEIKEMTITELTSLRPDLVDQIKESVTNDLTLQDKVKKLEEELSVKITENKTLSEKLDNYAVLEALAEKQKAVELLIEESKLPEDAVTEVFKEQLMEAKDDEARKAIIEDRKTLITEKKVTKKVTGMGDENISESKEPEKIAGEFKAALEG